MARQMKDSGIEWIGEIPAEWGIHTAFQLFMQVKNKNEGMQEDNLLSLSYGKIVKKSINTIDRPSQNGLLEKGPYVRKVNQAEWRSESGATPNFVWMRSVL